MRTGIFAITCLVAASMSADVIADTFPSSISRQPLITGPVPSRLSVGADYTRTERGVDFDDNLDSILYADTISAYVGYDVLSWLTAFVTAGASKIEEEDGMSADYGAKFSVGASAYLWDADVLVPSYMAGRLSIKAMIDAARHESDTDLGTVEWLDVTAALPIGFEKFDRYPTSASGLQTSLALYAGPAFSYLTGTADTRFGDIDFDGSQAFGVVGGVDIYFSPSVSIGAKVVAFDEVSYGASLRFHF